MIKDTQNVQVVGNVQIAGKNGQALNMIPWEAEAVVIASEIIYPRPGLVYVGVGGNIAIIPAGNPDANSADPTAYVVFKGIADGSFLPVYAKRIGDVGNGTTATDLVICF